MLNLKIIHASTREGRRGLPVSKWVVDAARKETDFEVEFIDLKELGLPFIDEPEHPRLKQYVHRHTVEWSNKIDHADAFIFVTCEYNHGMPATLKNTLDFLVQEWAFKPVAFVGYGGISAGTRAIQQLKQVTYSLKMFPFDGVLLPFFNTQISEEGVFLPTSSNSRALDMMFKELKRLGEGMKALR